MQSQRDAGPDNQIYRYRACDFVGHSDRALSSGLFSQGNIGFWVLLILVVIGH